MSDATYPHRRIRTVPICPYHAHAGMTDHMEGLLQKLRSTEDALDERLQALAAGPKLTTLPQWLALFDAPLSVDASAEQCLPLPALTVY